MAKREELIKNSVFQSHGNRLNNSKKVYAVLAEIVETRPLDRWLHDLDANNIPLMVVQTKEDLLEDEQLNATGFWRSMEHPTEGKLRFTDPPFRYTKSPSTIIKMPPTLGEQSCDILEELGYTHEELKGLIEKNVSKTLSKRG